MLRKLSAGILGVVVLAMALVSAACGGESLSDITPAIGVHEVAVIDDSYEPRVIQVSQGTEVTWVWDGKRQHNVIGEAFQSELQTEGTFSHTFDTPGAYRYLCTLHGGMTGAVIVTE